MTNPARKMTVASFDVDAQKGFTPLCPDELPVPGGDEIVGALNVMAQYANLRVGSKDSHSPDAAWVVANKADMLKATGLKNADLTWVSHCVPGTRGHELIDGLPSVEDYDFMVFKGVEPDLHPYGACYHDLSDKRSTGVIEFLQARGIKTVVVGGLALEFCVATTARQLQQAGFKVVLFQPAVRALDPAAGQQALANMQAIGIQIAANTDELSALL